MSKEIERLHLLHASITRSEFLENLGKTTGLTVITPNTHHLTRLKRLGAVRAWYMRNATNLLDSRPLDLIARACRRRRLYYPGSDLVADVIRTYGSRPWRVIILGGSRRTHEAPLTAMAPAWQLVGWDDSQINLNRNLDGQLVDFDASSADLVLVCLGFPKQEIVAQYVRTQSRGANILCVGAALDFVTGVKPRAPSKFTRLGIEWFFRALTEPRRLGMRYLRDGFAFPVAVVRVLRSRPTELAGRVLADAK